VVVVEELESVGRAGNELGLAEEDAIDTSTRERAEMSA
jgi:hypothetical protein